MLKSSNLNSVINELGPEASAEKNVLQSGANESNNNTEHALSTDAAGNSLAALQLSTGMLQIAEPPLVKARAQLKELIFKQNKIYIDLSKEKYKLDCTEVAKLNEMMNDVKIYKEKLIRIRKEMQNIYQRTKVLKKRAANVATTKQREYQRKLEKQQHEESLIASQTH
ncbi:biogenesis of lysosome-related organelles complex 1 subunit 6 [Scaptodrosophila lebanonensis]|uniref:Biogenesis of lysosome-related organelles complex 1 subunit 6 n=1 Tax=Drosophila lebanonensis TaxID=7225 RepID=A0A6J2TAY9_DROLE|nr:biogenesis of lysosome-related organelles complex 1 subunit 6 [Scaptodrosophila lebanonensis]